MRITSISVLVAFPALATAQTVQATAASLTDLTVFTPRSRQTVPAPRDLTAGIRVELAETGMSTRTVVTCDHSPASGTLYHLEDVWQVTSQYQGPHGAFGTGRHDTVLRLASARAVPGILRLSASSSVRGNATLTGEVDVGNNGSVEFTVVPGPRQSVDIPLVVDAAGTEIKTTTGTSGTTSNAPQLFGSSVRLTVEFLPAFQCNAVRFGDTCEPFLYLRTTFAHELEATIETRQNATVAALVLGVRSIALPLPRPGCGLLFTDPLVVLSGAVMQGTSRFYVPVPRGVRLRVNVQGAVVAPVGGTPAVFGTWAFAVTCP